jgi:glycosyltransferase involved in cell wall biosynthesis
MIADIFITTKNRPELLDKTLRSLKNHTDGKQYRLTLIKDGYDASTNELTEEWISKGQIDNVISSFANDGLGPSINRALSLVDVNNKWWEDNKVGDRSKVAPFICYVQDDVLFSAGWLEKLAKMFMLYEKQYNIGFASGIECIEHPVKKVLSGGCVLKDWIRATCMFARREYWMSMWPIPAFDVETGSLRAKPNNGMGSSVDWWFIRDHENSICRTGKTCLVIPGLLQHSGFDKSTWLKRELPESEADKLKILNG